MFSVLREFDRVVGRSAVAGASSAGVEIQVTSLADDFFLSSADEKVDADDALGRSMVLGAGRVVGSAVVALLAERADPEASVRAVDDGRSGLISVIDFRVPLDEVDVTRAGVIAALSAAGGGAAAETVFVDLDPGTEVFGGSGGGGGGGSGGGGDAAAPASATLACALLTAGASRVLFLRGSGADAAAALSACADRARGGGGARVGVVDWGARGRFVGPGLDPTAPGAPGDALTEGLRCLASGADALPYDAHGFETERLLALFFGAATGPECAAALLAAADFAGAHARLAANAAGDALAAALALARAPAAGATLVHVFTLEAMPEARAGAGALAPRDAAALADGAAIRNWLPSLRGFAPADAYGALEGALAPRLGASAPAARAFIDSGAWWVWRQALLHGFRDPEPLPVYDPATLVARGRYGIHDLSTFGVSHASGHVKMRHAQAIWGWRFKRGGIPWSSNQPDQIVAVRPIEPRQGSDYRNLALRTLLIWKVGRAGGGASEASPRSERVVGRAKRAPEASAACVSEVARGDYLLPLGYSRVSEVATGSEWAPLRFCSRIGGGDGK
jgi:hypothetical protein